MLKEKVLYKTNNASNDALLIEKLKGFFNNKFDDEREELGDEDEDTDNDERKELGDDDFDDEDDENDYDDDDDLEDEIEEEYDED